MGRLGPAGKKACLAIGYLLMLFVCWLLFSGALAQTRINHQTTSAAMEAPVSWFYASGVLFSVSAALLLLHDLWRLATGQMSEDELIAIRESEESTK